MVVMSLASRAAIESIGGNVRANVEGEGLHRNGPDEGWPWEWRGRDPQSNRVILLESLRGVSPPPGGTARERGRASEKSAITKESWKGCRGKENVQ